MANNFCAGGGYVGPPPKSVPTDPSEYSARGQRSVSLCSRILCRACGEHVRWFDDVFFEGREVDLFAAYDAQDADDLPSTGLFSFPTRLYLCRCQVLNSGSERPLSLATEAVGQDDLPKTWACGGHKPVKLLMTFQDEDLPADPDWAEVVESTFRRRGDPATPHRWPRWLKALYSRLGGTVYQRALDAAVTACLEGDDPLLISRAIDFYWAPHKAPGTARLRSLALDGRERLGAMDDPLGAADLHHKLLRAVAYHITTSGWSYDQDLKDCFHEHVGKPGHLGPLAWFLAEEDEGWLRLNRRRLLTIDPAAAVDVERWMG